MAREEFRYITLADAIALHIRAMESTGYTPAPLRDENALDSALKRPEMAAYYEQADLVRQAALLAIGISQRQAFVDGNKRTAVIITDVFLTLNHHVYTGDSIELAKQLENVAERESDLQTATANFEDWLRQRIVQSES